MAVTHIHLLLQGVDESSQDSLIIVNMKQVISFVMDHILPHMFLATVGLLAQTRKSFRFLTSDVPFLGYLMKLLPLQNSECTRRCFLLPRPVSLFRISRGMYCQAYSLHSAIQKYGGLHNFRVAVERRRKLTIKRREMRSKRALVAKTSRDRRLQMIINAVDVLMLPVHYRHHTLATLFINNIPPIPVSFEEERISVIVENICWVQYLVNYTDFCEQCENRRGQIGEYEGLERDVMHEFTKPEIWPWLLFM
jgi:hypothetical protein